MSKTSIASIEASFKRTAQKVKHGSKLERAGRFISPASPKKRETLSKTKENNNIRPQKA